MINSISQSENENNSINNEDKNNYYNEKNKKEKNLNSYITPYLSTIPDCRYTQDNYDFLLEKDLEEISGIIPYNIKSIKNFKEEQRINDIILEKKIQNNYTKKFIIEKPDKIFCIKKETKLGRPKKNSIKKGMHNKFKKDNLIRRFKTHFFQNIYNYINLSFKCNKEYNDKKIINMIQKISSNDTKSISKSDNIKWFNSKVKSIISQKISTKIVSFDSNYNYNLIQKVYKMNVEQDVIKILEKTIREMWIIYINDDKDKEFPGFNTLKDDINKLREMKEPEEYIQQFTYTSKNFENIFNKIKPRKKKIMNIKK